MAVAVVVRLYAGAREAAGAERVVIDHPPETLGGLVAELSRRGGATQAGTGIAEVLSRCSFLGDGRRLDEDAALGGVSTVDVMPPFAGG
ncbi:MoaD/ThiS family protein [Corynebacterium otitidis]|uniref:MoaD/ThiS family protein n=1 Tax=Corynebacterium otitidis TaxID=29321 RepID=UPI000570BDA6|nr:MoaD/ThiS family protein [Corynebacterium otitidis]